jgi:fructosamine-3-kinase
MSCVNPDFTVPTVPDEAKYEGTEIDENLRKGRGTMTDVFLRSSCVALPADSKNIWVAPHGASFRSITTKIDTELPDGSQKSYFVKVRQAALCCFMTDSRKQLYIAPNAKALALGEYLSSQAMYAIIPDNTPRPMGRGVLAKDSNKHFIVFDFIDMIEELPPVAELAGVIAKLHQNSVSPNGKFGFGVPTSQSLQLENTWRDTWEEFFTRVFRDTVELEQRAQGQNNELLELAQQICEKVIPRLLRPMENDGRTLKPTLLHGALWHGNIGLNALTDSVILFDCGGFYGHHECE